MSVCDLQKKHTVYAFQATVETYTDEVIANGGVCTVEEMVGVKCRNCSNGLHENSGKSILTCTLHCLLPLFVWYMHNATDVNSRDTVYKTTGCLVILKLGVSHTDESSAKKT